MPSETLSVDIIGNSSSATRAFRETADSALLASKAAKDLSDKLALQSKTAQVSAGATLAMVKADALLRDAELELSGAAEEARRKLDEQGRAAEDAGIKTRLAGDAAKGAGGGFGALATPMTALVGAGVLLSPVLVTTALGLGGLGLAAYGATKDTKAMGQVLGPLKEAVGTFQQELKPEVLTLFGKGAGIAAGLLSDIEPVAAATGKALGGVLDKLGATFASGNWQQFFTFMAQTAGPDVQLLGDVIVNLTNDLPPLLESLQPVAVAILTTVNDVLKLTGALDGADTATIDLQQTWAQEHSGGFLDKILAWVQGAQQYKSIAEGSATATGDLTGNQDALAHAVAKSAPQVAQLAGAMKDTASHAATAAPRVGTLAGDMSLLDAAVASGNSQLAAYNNLWDIFVGKSVSDQQAVLNVQQAFDSYNQAAANSKKTSAQVQLAFLSIFTTLGTGLDTLHKNNASVSQLNDFYAVNIARLQALHGLTPQQRQDIQGLIRDYDAWANSTQGLDKKTVTAAHDIASQFVIALQNAHHWTPQVSSDLGAMASSILKTGDNSRSTASDRARLISDLESAGLKARDATGLVGDFQTAIDLLHGKGVTVTLNTAGQGVITITGSGIPTKTINTTTGQVSGGGGHTAKGWLVSGGTPGRDSVPIMAMPGELVVPTSMVRAGAVDHLRGKIPGFAAGGVVGKVAAAEGGIGTAEAQWGQLAATAFASAALKAAQAAAAASGGFGGAGSGALGGDPAANRALAMRTFPWPASMWPAFDYLEMREAGYNRFARNPSSGAYGIPQALPESKLPFAGQSAGGSHAGPQLSWMYGYIGGRYGNPVNAAAHEAAFSWYGSGLDAVFRRPTVIGVGDRGAERVQVTPVTAGRGGGDVHVHVHNHGVIGSQAEVRSWLNSEIDALARTGRLEYALRRSPSAA